MKVQQFIRNNAEIAIRAWRTEAPQESGYFFEGATRLHAREKANQAEADKLFAARKELTLSRGLFEARYPYPGPEIGKITELEGQKESVASAQEWVEQYARPSAGKKAELLETASAADAKAVELAEKSIEPFIKAYEYKNSQKVLLEIF